MRRLRPPMSFNTAYFGVTIVYWLLQVGVASLYLAIRSDRWQAIASFLESPNLDFQTLLMILASLLVFGLTISIMMFAGLRMRDQLGQIDYVGISILATTVSLAFHLAIVAGEIPGAISVLSAFPR